MSHLLGGIFPTMSEFFPPCRYFTQFPSYMPGKIPSLLMEGLPGLSDAKNAVGDSKNIPLTAEGIIRRKAISRKSAETVSFFLQVPRPNANTPARVAAGCLFQYLFTNQPCLSAHQLILLSDCWPKFLLSCRHANFLSCFSGSWLNCLLFVSVLSFCFLYTGLLSDYAPTMYLIVCLLI
jgi:hypothetical protein